MKKFFVSMTAFVLAAMLTSCGGVDLNKVKDEMSVSMTKITDAYNNGADKLAAAQSADDIVAVLGETAGAIKAEMANLQAVSEKYKLTEADSKKLEETGKELTDKMTAAAAKFMGAITTSMMAFATDEEGLAKIQQAANAFQTLGE